MRHRIGFIALSLAIATACGSSSPQPAAPAPTEPPPATGPEPDVDPAENPETPVGSPATPGPETPAEPKVTWATKDTGVKVADDWRKCAADDECELVQTTCCDVCNGGKVAAVNKSKNADVKKKFPSKCKPNDACTERGCNTRAACEKNLCVLQWESAAP